MKEEKELPPLHFTVDPAFLVETAKQAYWFEEWTNKVDGKEITAQQWAWELISSIQINGKALSADYVHNLLMGDLTMVFHEENNTLSILEQEDKAFKKKLRANARYLIGLPEDRDEAWEKVNIAGFDVPLWLLENYARRSFNSNQLVAHQAIFDYCIEKYPVFAEWDRLEGNIHQYDHMHLESAQMIAEWHERGEKEPNARYKVALFAIALDKIIGEMRERKR